MTEYTVTIDFRGSFEATVQADNPGQALDKARDELNMEDIHVTQEINSEVQEEDVFG